MDDFIPARPEIRPGKFGLVKGYFRARRDSFRLLTDRAYSMKLAQIRLPVGSLFIVNEPTLVRRILVEFAGKYPKSRIMHGALKPLLGNGVFVSNGAVWERQRRMIDPAFDARGLEELFPLMLGAVQAMAGRLIAHEGEDMEIDVETAHVTADIIFRTIFSIPMDRDDSRAVFAAFNHFQNVTPGFALLQFLPLPHWLFPGRIRSRKAGAKIRELLRRFAKPRFDAARRGAPAPYNDILAALLKARDPVTGYMFEFEDLVDQIGVLFLAGHETSASALAWALYLIANCPHLQERLHAEAAEVMQDGGPRFAHIRQLKFTRDVFRETLRLYPPVGFTIRDATEHETMRGKKVCPADTLIMSQWLIHRHRGHWDRPDAFDPDRFATASGKASLKTCYLPFSIGPRVCPGAGFALQEAVLILAVLARAMRFDPVPGHEPKPVNRLTVRSANGIRLRVTRR